MVKMLPEALIYANMPLHKETENSAKRLDVEENVDRTSADFQDRKSVV